MDFYEAVELFWVGPETYVEITNSPFHSGLGSNEHIIITWRVDGQIRKLERADLSVCVILVGIVGITT